MIISYYMAAPWEERATVNALVSSLNELSRDSIALAQHQRAESGVDHEPTSLLCTSTWIDFVHDDPVLDSEMDLNDVARSDVFVQFNPKSYERNGTGGRHTEMGYAMAKGLPVLIVGARTQVFHHRTIVTLLEKPHDVRAVFDMIAQLGKVTR